MNANGLGRYVLGRKVVRTKRGNATLQDYRKRFIFLEHEGGRQSVYRNNVFFLVINRDDYSATGTQ